MNCHNGAREAPLGDDELFTRLFYYGKVQLGFSTDEVWLLPFGELLDLWECHKQYNGMAKAKKVESIDDVVPFGV